MGDGVLDKIADNIRGVDVDLTKVQAHVISPKHTRGVTSDTGFNDPAHVPLNPFLLVVPVSLLTGLVSMWKLSARPFTQLSETPSTATRCNCGSIGIDPHGAGKLGEKARRRI